MILDDWQKEVLETKGNICLRSGRQVGKTEIISRKSAIYAIENPKKLVLVIASVERQAYHLFEKILAYLLNHHKNQVKSGKDRPTKTKINLKNGSTIYCLPTGLTGQGIRGYTVDLLIADEAAFIPEEVWTAVTPMLSVTKGSIILLSTPHGKEGYYYECFKDQNFKSFHISSLDCPRIDKHFLERERARMTKIEFSQEYEGHFVDELRQFFPNDLILKCMTLSRENTLNNSSLKPAEPFLGVDVARLGMDETVLCSMNRIDKDKLQMFDLEITTKTYLTETILRIKEKDKQFNFKKIYIDTGGIGAGVFDVLLQEDQTKRKVVAIDNAQRSLNRDETKKTKLMKEDLYTNLLRLMENGNLQLFNDPEIMLSLKSVQYEYTDKGELKIFGNYTHITESLVRAAWCVKDKTLNIWVRW